MEMTHLVISSSIVILLSLILSSSRNDVDETKEGLKKLVQKKLDQAIDETKEIEKKLEDANRKGKKF